MSSTHRAQTARDRVRAELITEIKASARRQLIADGAAALSLRAVARDLGMVSSALYRYFPSRDALLTALIIDAYRSIGDAVELAESSVHGSSVLVRWLAIGRGVRLWALAHPQEYALVFGSPVPGYVAPTETIDQASRIPALLSSLLGDLFANSSPRPSVSPPTMTRKVHRALAPARVSIPVTIPDELIASGLMAWTYLFGAVSFEVFGHRHAVIGDPTAFFDYELNRLAELLGLAD